jgi:hypothetical protein
MFRPILSFLFHSIPCLGLAALLSAGQASAQTAAPEVAARMAERAPKGGIPALTAGTPRQQAWLRSTVNERVQIAESLGEDGARAFVRSRGLTPLLDGTEQSLLQGLDQVYTATDGTVHVVEAKGGGSPLGKAYGFEQGTPEWAVESAKRVATSGKAGSAEKVAAEAVLKAAKRGRLEVHVVRTRHVLGEPTAAVLERSMGSTADAVKLATSALDDLARSATAETRNCTPGAEAIASASEGATGAAEPTAKVLGTVAKGAVVVGVAADVALRVHTGTEIEGRFARGELGQQGREVAHTKNVAGMVGGWGGAWAGMELGAAGGGAVGTACGGVGAPFGAAAGGLAGGVAGYFGGEAAAEAAAGWVVRQVHATGTTIAGAAETALNAAAQAAGAAGNAVRSTWSRVTGW